MYRRDNCIKSDIWSDVILLVRITLFCDQGRKSESLEKKKDDVIDVFFQLGVSSLLSLTL